VILDFGITSPEEKMKKRRKKIGEGKLSKGNGLRI
jgi:hypothetical protein